MQDRQAGLAIGRQEHQDQGPFFPDSRKTNRISMYNQTGGLFSGCGICVGYIPHPAIVSIRDNQNCIRGLLYSYSTMITGGSS